MSSHVQLGSFQLASRIGSGGMAEVWRGRDTARERPVAVKVIKPTGPQHTQIREQFRREVEAIARLRHPGIITIYDYGVIDRHAARASGGELPAGSPYLAMEFANVGELEPLDHVDGWPDLADLLFQILNALAFAHARDVIHRDLKPANVLLVDGEERRFKLSDFGIAHALDPYHNPSASDVDTTASGTPHFMPPEQLRGQWRDFGPWTDLYALGCVAHTLVSGSVPFPGSSLFEISRQHLDAAPPRLEPRFAVPEGLADWIDRLMKKNPNYRYRHAADAARALAKVAPGRASRHSERWTIESDTAGSTDRQMGAVRIDGEIEPEPTDGGGESVVSVGTVPADMDTVRLDLDDSDEETADHDSEEGFGFADTMDVTAPGTPGPATPGEMTIDFDNDEALPEPPIVLPDDPPRTHPGETPSPPSTRLFSLRDIPLVDRVSESDEIWNGLDRAMAGGGPQGFLLRGPEGHGKSKLAEWFSRAAHECGCATVLRADHGAFRGPTSGLARMLEVFFKVWDLDRPDAYRRIRNQLAGIYRRSDSEVVPRYLEDDARALTEIIRPQAGETDSETDGSQFTFSSLDERNVVIGRLVAQLAAIRPVVLQLDDLHWGPETLAFVEQLVAGESTAGAPIVVVMTARKANLEDRPEVERHIETLAERERITDLSIGRLDEDNHRALVRGVLQLDDDLARRVQRDTEGNPLFAIQLVNEWVDRGDVMPGESGFEAAPGANLTIPDSVETFWNRRLSRFLPILRQNAGEDALESLYLAAALGENVNTREWERLCADAGLDGHQETLNTLVRFGLAERRPDSWSFAFGKFHSALAKHAELDNCWRDSHAACAAMLEREYGHRQPEARRRIALHLLAAGEYEAALEPLLESVHRAMRMGKYNDAEYLVDRRLDAIDQLGLPATDRRRLDTWIVAARMYKVAGRADRAVDYIDRALPRLRSTDWREGLGRALGVKATLSTDEGDFDRAYEYTSEAETHLRGADEADDALAEILRTRGGILYYQANLDEADNCFRTAADLFARSNDLANQARCLNFQATIAIADGDWRRAETTAEDALETARLLRHPVLEADCLNNLAEIARGRSDFGDARTRYRQADVLWKRSGSRDFVTAELNVALCDVASDDPEAVGRVLPTLTRDVDAHGIGFYRPFTDLLAGFCTAAEQNWNDWDEHVDRAIASTEEMELVDRDLGWLAEQVGERTADAGQPSRARRVLALAFQQYEEVGDPTRAEAVRERIDDLS